MAEPMIIKVENQKINLITEENPIILKQTGQGMPGRDGAFPVWGNITGNISDQTDLQNALDAKADSADLGALATKDTADFYDDISNKPAGYPPSPHNHDDRYYTEGETDTLLAGKSDTGHTHTVSDVTDLPTLGNLAEQDTVDYDTDITNLPTLGALADHDTVDYETEITNLPTLGTMSVESASDYYDIDDTNALITANVESSMVATRNYNTGDLFICGGTLYRATTNISNGATLTSGTNVTATTIASELALKASTASLGTMATVNDAASDSTYYVRQNGAWVALPVYNGGVS